MSSIFLITSIITKKIIIVNVPSSFSQWRILTYCMQSTLIMQIKRRMAILRNLRNAIGYHSVAQYQKLQEKNVILQSSGDEPNCTESKSVNEVVVYRTDTPPHLSWCNQCRNLQWWSIPFWDSIIIIIFKLLDGWNYWIWIWTVRRHIIIIIIK